jgi:RNA polymerase sigma-70 factor (sigma-E family)
MAGAVLMAPTGTRAATPPPAVAVAPGPVATVAGAVESDFEEFVAARGAALVRIARGLLRDPHHAEDVVQDVLAKALVKWSSIQRADDPDAYVRRMVVNACTSFWRRAVRREYSSDHDSLPERRVPDATGDVAERDRMLALLRRLPPKQRAVLVLRHYEGLADAEIADLLGSSAVTVRSNAHRGLATLRSMLAEDDGSRLAEGGGRGGA